VVKPVISKLQQYVYDSFAYYPVKTRLSESEAEAEESINHRNRTHCYWFILPLLLVTLTMQFLLESKRRSHKWMRCSASDSVGLIFTRSYRFTLLTTTPTTTPSSVKTRLKKQETVLRYSVCLRIVFADTFR